jgi:hypothetical protein
MLHTVTQAQIDEFVAGCARICDEHLRKSYPESFELLRETVEAEIGQRYARVYRVGRAQRSAHCFIDLTNGDVLKAASWKAPEKKNPRGNLNDAHKGLRGMTPYGTVYLR